MADRETELEWEKSKRIEAERTKAVKALEEGDKELRVNSAFLDPENTKIKGYSRDESRIIRSIEKVSGLSIGFVILGIVMVSMSRVSIMVGAPAPLAILFNIISTIGMVVLFASPILAVVALWFNYRSNKNDKSVITNSVVALVVFVIYVIVHFAIIK